MIHSTEMKSKSRVSNTINSPDSTPVNLSPSIHSQPSVNTTSSIVAGQQPQQHYNVTPRGGNSRSLAAPIVSACRHLLQPNGSINGDDVATAVLPHFDDLSSTLPVDSFGDRFALYGVDGKRGSSRGLGRGEERERSRDENRGGHEDAAEVQVR